MPVSTGASQLPASASSAAGAAGSNLKRAFRPAGLGKGEKVTYVCLEGGEGVPQKLPCNRGFYFFRIGDRKGVRIRHLSVWTTVSKLSHNAVKPEMRVAENTC